MELKCPQIKEKKIYYGGNQEWFEDRWAKMAGCASVCATNVYVYYLQENKIYTKKEYLAYQNYIYEYVKPGKRGYPYIYLYARSIGKLLNKTYKIVRNPGVEKGKAFIQESIDARHPVSLLILSHLSFRLHEDKWHWVTIFGYDEQYIYYSSYGKRKKIKANILLKKHRFNVVKMVRFE